MTKFEQPPAQHIETLQTLRGKLVRSINIFTEVLLENVDMLSANPRLALIESRAVLASQITAHELTVARIDREIAAMSQNHISLPSDSDSDVDAEENYRDVYG